MASRGIRGRGRARYHNQQARGQASHQEASAENARTMFTSVQEFQNQRGQLNWTPSSQFFVSQPAQQHETPQRAVTLGPASRGQGSPTTVNRPRQPRPSVVWCNRCNRGFGSHQALGQHRRMSGRHHICSGCDFDYERESEMEDCGCRASEYSLDYEDSVGTASDDGIGGITWDTIRDSLRYHSSWNISDEFYEFGSRFASWPPHHSEYSDWDTASTHTSHDTLDEEDDGRRREDDPYCIRCNRHFGSLQALWSHCRMSSVHPWWCGECRTDFEREDDLNAHKAERHNGPPFRTFQNSFTGADTAFSAPVTEATAARLVSSTSTHPTAAQQAEANQALEDAGRYLASVPETIQEIANMSLNARFRREEDLPSPSSADPVPSTSQGMGPTWAQIAAASQSARERGGVSWGQIARRVTLNPAAPAFVPLQAQPEPETQSSIAIASASTSTSMISKPPTTASGVPPAGTSTDKTKEAMIVEGIRLTCPLCLDPPEVLTSTLCGHLFCKECIVAAVRHKPECPVCRAFSHVPSLHPVYLNVTGIAV